MMAEEFYAHIARAIEEGKFPAGCLPHLTPRYTITHLQDIADLRCFVCIDCGRLTLFLPKQVRRCSACVTKHRLAVHSGTLESTIRLE
jgi:hypothetical protein